MRFAPSPIGLAWRERLRSCVGALLGIAFTGTITHVMFGSGANIPMLVAPMGASAVLLFAVPASPLAQPWSIIGGNLISATLGVACASWIPDPLIASALAVGAAICAMFALRCVHPPSGAVALTAVLGGPAVHALSYRFVIEPIALQSAALLGAALVYHALTGHRYPHSAPTTAQTKPTIAGHGPGFTRGDLDAVLKNRSELLDIAPDDLEGLLRALQLQTYTRSFSELTCADIMTRGTVAVSPDADVATARGMLRRHGAKALPVTDATQRVVGIVTRADLGDNQTTNSCINVWHNAFGRHRTDESRVVAVMTQKVCTVAASMPIADLVPLFAHCGHHHLPVLDDHTGELAGMVTQADLISGLCRRPNPPAQEMPHQRSPRRAA